MIYASVSCAGEFPEGTESPYCGAVFKQRSPRKTGCPRWKKMRVGTGVTIIFYGRLKRLIFAGMVFPSYG
jgi:hypothetical protein